MLKAPVIQIIGFATESEKLPHNAGDMSTGHHWPMRNGSRHICTYISQGTRGEEACHNGTATTDQILVMGILTAFCWSVPTDGL